MNVGVVFPQTEIGDDPAVIKEFAQTAEQLGFSHILAFDHVLGAVHADRNPPLTGPYTEESAFHEPFVLFAYLAGITRRIGFQAPREHLEALRRYGTAVAAFMQYGEQTAATAAALGANSRPYMEGCYYPRRGRASCPAPFLWSPQGTGACMRLPGAVGPPRPPGITLCRWGHCSAAHATGGVSGRA